MNRLLKPWWIVGVITALGLSGCETQDDDDAADDDAADDDTGDDDTADDDDDAVDDDDAADDDDSADDDECENWQTAHPEWIFCDDFESADPLEGDGRYFEHDDNDGEFVVLDGAGHGGSRGMRALFQSGEVSAGSIKVAFGNNPSSYMDTGIRPGEDFREVYYRMYLKMQAGWDGDPAKLSRATVFHGDDWSQAMIAHLWGDGDEHLLLDPATCVDGSGQVICSGYNDFASLDWLGYTAGTTAVFDTPYSDVWYCVEHHVRLNDAGAANGVQEFWIDEVLEARRDGLDFVGTYSDYAINAVFFENYWNDGSIQEQERYFDRIVISTEYVGCS